MNLTKQELSAVVLGLSILLASHRDDFDESGSLIRSLETALDKLQVEIKK